MRFSNYVLSLLALGAAASQSIEHEKNQQGSLRGASDNSPFQDLGILQNHADGLQEEDLYSHSKDISLSQSYRRQTQESKLSSLQSKDDSSLEKKKTTDVVASKKAYNQELEISDEQQRRLQDGPPPLETWTPTNAPTRKPTYFPTSPLPTGQPTGQPTEQPSTQPSSEPSSQPSGEPTFQPTIECKEIENVQFTTEVFNETEVGKFLNLTTVSSVLSEFVEDKCGLHSHLANDLNSCVDVINLRQVNTTDDIAKCSAKDKSITALEFITCINSNPEVFKDEQICFNVQKGNFTETKYGIKECNNTANDVLASVGFNCKSIPEETVKDDNVDTRLNDFLFYFSLVGGAMQLAGIVYLGAKKEVGHGLTYCQRNEEFFNNVFDSFKENKMGFVIGAGTLATIGISKLALGEDDFLKNVDSYLPELALAIPNAIALAAIGNKIRNSDNSTSAANSTFAIHPDLNFDNRDFELPNYVEKPEPKPSSRKIAIDGPEGEEIDIVPESFGTVRLDEGKRSGGCIIS